MSSPLPPPQTPNEALDYVKGVVRFIAPASLVNDHAFKLLGEPPERMEKMLADIRAEVADGMASCNPAPSQARIFSMSLAFVEIVRERVVELTYSRGRA